jgi:ArsR family metal-binding transcriptional regulator
MQLIRLKLIKDLQVVFDMAKRFAQRKDGKSKDDKITVKQRQGWVSIMVYTGQVMNSITKSFDEAQVTKDLERLEKMINEAMATEKNRAVDPAS